MQECGKPYCPEHPENTGKINKHDGMWTLLMWTLGGVATLLVIFCGAQYASQRAVEKSVANIDKALTSHIKVSEVLLSSLDKTIVRQENDVVDMLYRVRALEIVGD